MTRHVTDMDIRVGVRLRYFRLLNGLTQQEFADRICVTYQQAHKYEKGINRISAGRLWKCWEELGVSPNEFFAGIYDQPIEPTGYQRQMLEFMKIAKTLSAEKLRVIAASIRALESKNPEIG